MKHERNRITVFQVRKKSVYRTYFEGQWLRCFVNPSAMQLRCAPSSSSQP